MEFEIRPFAKESLPAVDQLDHLMWLFLQYHGDYAPENAFCAWQGEKLAGFCCLGYTAGWHAGPEQALPRKLTLSLRVEEEIQDPDLVRGSLLDALIGRMQELALARPGEEVALGAFAEEDDG